jgi:TM2 domain-containing membrane protein YozV
MDCANHKGVSATAYCQNCGKPLCTDCIIAGAMRSLPNGQILCESCIAAWQSLQPPFAGLQPHGPSPVAAAVLGLIPGVGAMYNGQFLKGFIHVVVFAVLVGITGHYPLCGLFIAAWILYQSFEAYHTAKALRDGDPVPDPLGLNEVSNWLNLGARLRNSGQPAAGQAAASPASCAPGANPAGAAGTATGAGGYPPPYTGQYEQPYLAPYQPPYQAPYQAPSQAPNQPPFTPPPAGFTSPVAPPPPAHWRHREPVGAIVLIALGLLFLLDQLEIFRGRFMEFAWPLLLIALGVWLIVRRIEESQGGSK